MEAIIALIGDINGIVWGPAMLALLAGTGLYLTLGLKLTPQRKLFYGFSMLWRGRKSSDEGDISPFNALMTALSATVGTGNIAGVATAVFLGGPGALFWMWVIALVGMATKFCEAVLAVRYREKDARGNHVGGPMYYIKNGLGEKWKWLGMLFAIFGMLAGFGIGNTIQSNSVADALSSSFNIPKLATGIIIAVLVALVLLGGIKRIGEVAGKLVPIMAIFYVGGGLIILILHADKIPEAFSQIFYYAFNPSAAAGGFAGATVWMAMRFGIARGVFSNEAGLGSAPIAHAAAQTNNPIRQGTIAMLGTFIDTIIICSITGLVIMVTGAWTSGENGAPLSALAFSQGLPGSWGQYIVSIGLAVFAFTTIIGWSFYSEKCTQFLFGERSNLPFRLLWIIAIPLGTLPGIDLNSLWLVADTLNAMMAIPNLIALLLLSPVVFKLTKDYFADPANYMNK
ncbi:MULTISPECIES: alanine/glycine:cation symporter family protein [Pseudomonas]|jgi:AGCS family alanine or glycine:cation symporter|uniref:Sodium:alanine symporter family protein n=2 Tax=Pseudomonas abyssi TaxID=170540 RepID=A0A2A3MM08_9PSED|nr:MULTISPECIES: sodium:alanine symporter family protein [Pseudomonadaceae]MAC99602.1 sodium:alanine symporter family protein [Pseudomonadales bacterium]MAG66426.1 sodium:alanine symporter family protein [Pseudomonadales bacterium]PBK05841.1 sodium:alanine symporter family protein [Pseudomonas abyssi]RGP54361.1 sodium:alanine symporter [Halopseudomonas gallaeciensis]|tara:strand:- start:136631 stop:137995 length:1365 start_codon:yes stop_codon:yes gene_type:complete